MNSYYARVLSNNRGWKKPAGVARDGKKTFFGKYGFGFDEWLFDPSAEIDGWQYGFLQPVCKGYKKRVGLNLSLKLYTIPGGGFENYREEFAITLCQVLSRHQAEVAYHVFKENGRLKRMVKEIEAVEGESAPLLKPGSEFENVINVRFRMADVTPLAHVQPSMRGDYYCLYEIPFHDSDDAGAVYPDEADAGRTEGHQKVVTVNIFERDPKARRDCLAFLGFKCQVCRMSFEERYGPFGRGMIHVHHLIPLAARRKEYKVNGRRDLIPVCPNCHAMLHWGKEPPTVEQLRERYRAAEKGR